MGEGFVVLVLVLVVLVLLPGLPHDVERLNRDKKVGNPRPVGGWKKVKFINVPWEDWKGEA